MCIPRNYRIPVLACSIARFARRFQSTDIIAGMNIGKDNFDAVLPTVIDSIKRSSFVAIDTELTGLSTASWLGSSQVDSLDSRYARSKTAATKIGVVQFGICCFEYDSLTNTLTSRPYAFHIWPQVSPLGGNNGQYGSGGDVHAIVQTSR